MFKGIAGQIVLALTLTIVLPLALEAQQSARIGVSARVVRSAVPETEAATAWQLSRLAATGVSDASTERHSMATERGLAQVVTERLTGQPDPVGQPVPTIASESAESALARVLITVAFTAN